MLDSPTVSLLGSPVSRASAEMVTEGVKDEMLHPQDEGGTAAMTGIGAPTVRVMNVCQ